MPIPKRILTIDGGGLRDVFCRRHRTHRSCDRVQALAYMSSFDSDDDNDGQPDIRGIPEWVSYETREYSSHCDARGEPTTRRNQDSNLSA